MNQVKQKISYIEGLLAGYELHTGSKEGKVIYELTNLCKQLIEQLEHLKSQLEEQESYLEAVDEDLAEIEELLFDDEEALDDEDEDETIVTKHVMNMDDKSGEIHYYSP